MSILLGSISNTKTDVYHELNLTVIMMTNFRVALYYKVQSSYYVVTGNNLFYNLLIETGCLAAPEQSFPFCPLVCLITFGIRLFQNSNSFALYFCFPLGFTSRAR